MEYEVIVLKVAELFLKSSPVRKKMEKQLVVNVRAALRAADVDFDKVESGDLRILVYTSEISEALGVLKKVPGIVTLTPALEVGSRAEAIESAVLDLADEVLTSKETFAVRVNRAWKGFGITSKDLASQIGAKVVERIGAKVGLTAPDVMLSVDILSRKSFVFSKVIRGQGGLPVGVSGRVLLLADGSRDSFVAGLLMLRRGVELITLHLRKSEKEQQEYLNEIKRLQDFSAGHPVKVMYQKFEGKGPRDMFKAAEKIAKEKDCGAIVVPWLEIPDYLSKIVKGLELPVFYPLVGLSETEISKLAESL